MNAIFGRLRLLGTIAIGLSAVPCCSQAASRDVCNIAVIEDDGTLTYRTGDTITGLRLPGVTQAFYQTHPDEFDFLAIFMSRSFERIGPIGSVDRFERVSNDAAGIGLDVFDSDPVFGSGGRLQAIAQLMPDTYCGSECPMTEEALSRLGRLIGRRWGPEAYYRDDLGDCTNLWAYDGAWSPFAISEGSLLSRVRLPAFSVAAPPPMSGTWQRGSGNLFRRDYREQRFISWDLYLMGLLPPEEVPPLQVLRDIRCDDGSGDLESCDLLSARIESISLDKVVSCHGPRHPSAQVGTVYRQAFVLVVPPGNDDVTTSLAAVEAVRSQWAPFWERATAYRSTMDTRLTSACGDGVTTPLCEQCDDGVGNSNTEADACRDDCLLPRCGDGVVDAGEECDDLDRNYYCCFHCRYSFTTAKCFDPFFIQFEAACVRESIPSSLKRRMTQRLRSARRFLRKARTAVDRRAELVQRAVDRADTLKRIIARAVDRPRNGITADCAEILDDIVDRYRTSVLPFEGHPVPPET